MTTKKMSKQPERRANRRIQVNMWVREEREDYYFLYKATDISEGGLFLEKKIERPNCLARSTFKFTLPKSSRLISVDGTVAFTTTSSQNARSGSGIRFIEMTNQDKKLIHKFLRQNY